MKHTPGPWEIYEGGNFVRIGASGFIKDSDVRGYMGGPLSVAEVEHNATDNHDPNHKKAMANARLIAAAPCLLEAALGARLLAKHALRFPNGTHGMDCYTTCIACSLDRAIDKAEGRKARTEQPPAVHSPEKSAKPKDSTKD